jgi:Uma2 family endonuclease
MIRVSASRFRIPDVCVISRDQAIEPVFAKPPLVCIEVLSKDDALRSMQARIDDYRAFGVPNIWILDPYRGAPTSARERVFVNLRTMRFAPPDRP